MTGRSGCGGLKVNSVCKIAASCWPGSFVVSWLKCVRLKSATARRFKIRQSHGFQARLTVQIAKNLILAGIKLSISDPSVVCPEDTAANFFVTAEDVGSRVSFFFHSSLPTLALFEYDLQRDSSSCPRIQELNPLSNVAVLEPPLLPAQGDVPSGGGNLEATCAAHTVVVLGDASAEEQAAVSTAAASAGVACIILNNSGLYTLAHLCLGKHTFTQCVPMQHLHTHPCH